MTGISRRVFLLDANVLIAAYRSYYAFDLCPGFWKSMAAGHSASRVFSTRRVKSEVMKGEDALADWVAATLPESFFLDDYTADIAGAYAPLMTWVMARGFLPAACSKFASDADGWLVAMAKHNGYCLVTQETRKDDAKRQVPIPNVCEEFRVGYCNTFEMLRDLGCSYH